MSSHVEQIKEKLGIVDVVGSYVELEKAGANFKARCPFHNEKTPSFFVSPVRNSYYCFGCGAKGDIISFVQEFEGLDFIGALRVLAKRAGVELTRENPKLRTERERLYLTMEYAALFFERQLRDNEKVLDYLHKRGLTDTSIRGWRLGYAPNDWRALSTYLASKKITVSEMEKVGLVKKSEKGDHDAYDRFRGRITFPIFDASSRVIAFSGRQIESDGTEAKYINSPETPLFEKSKVLYGYDRAKLDIRKKDYSLLVEGQMDLIMSHQGGFTNAVASSGTALTLQQLEILRRLSNKIIIAYDGDDAGGEAAKRGWQLALSLGMEVTLATLPQDKDPADVVLENPDLFKKAITKARHIIDVELERIMARPLEERERKKAIEKELLPYVAGVESMAEKSHFISEIAYKARMKEDLLWDIVRKIPPASLGREEKTSLAIERKSQERKTTIARMLIGLVYWQERAGTPTIQGLDIRQKMCIILGADTVADLERSFNDVRDDLIFEAEVSFSQSDNLAHQSDELINNLKEELLREEFTETMRRLQEAERSKDNKKTLELLKRCQELSLELRNITEHQ